MADDTPQDTAPQDDASTTEPATGEDALGDAGKQALDRMKAERNDAAKALKAAQKELEQLRQAQMSESEKAVSEAEARGRASAAADFGQKLAAARFVAEAARRNAEFDATAVLEDLNLAKYVTDDGEPDAKGIAAVVERLVPEKAAPAGPRFGNADLGPRSTPTTPTDGSPRSLIAAGIAAADAAKR
jgi:ElaB/YqjD/DUF883 family membrane-anchored ribosome-binding protein